MKPLHKEKFFRSTHCGKPELFEGAEVTDDHPQEVVMKARDGREGGTLKKMEKRRKKAIILLYNSNSTFSKFGFTNAKCGRGNN